MINPKQREREGGRERERERHAEKEKKGEIERFFLRRRGTMYCAYTIPGMTGSSLMYYYNGKAVRRELPSLRTVSCLPP